MDTRELRLNDAGGKVTTTGQNGMLLLPLEGMNIKNMVAQSQEIPGLINCLAKKALATILHGMGCPFLVSVWPFNEIIVSSSSLISESTETDSEGDEKLPRQKIIPATPPASTKQVRQHKHALRESDGTLISAPHNTADLWLQMLDLRDVFGQRFDDPTKVVGKTRLVMAAAPVTQG
ncbi:hypothetical protein KL905_002220 [Ogataea polymorpha]|nr:hypothetical protein KL908_002705 [Ogataea polymorpha]KAG7905627.1 hypothetical protein KL907_002774 [Ogataea polymorpha]KAG7922198.1 hypothetical protein KL905_002220 [Ogataea polymorpha]